MALDFLEKRRSFEAPLTIGVIADTHIYQYSSRAVPPQVYDLLRRAGVGLILHLGDVNAVWVLEELSRIAPIVAVVGNNDEDELQDMLPDRVRFKVGSHRFGMIHGDGGRSAKDQVKRVFAGKVDMAFFGHSHIPLIEESKGTILFNPGSATERRWHQHFGVGVVRVTETLIDHELILFANPEHLVNITFESGETAPYTDERATS